MATKHKTVKKTTKKAAKPIKRSISVKKAVNKKAVAKKPVAKLSVKKPVKPKSKKVAAKPVITKRVTAKMVKPAHKAQIKKMAKNIPAKPTASKQTKAKDAKASFVKPVIIPKITTKTVRKYQPEFTKSVLDRPKSDPGAPTMRYSDPELAEFREIIMRKLEAAKKELSYLHGLITRKDDMGGDETDNRYMTMEDGSLSMEREQLSQMASRQITFIDHLEKAIMRIENKTYGICRITGRLIDKARLRAVPHATLSIEAKMSSVK
jgi:RNA polymerase-binding transcription factor DksA